MLKDGLNQTDPINTIIMKTKASPPKTQSVFISDFLACEFTYVIKQPLKEFTDKQRKLLRITMNAMPSGFKTKFDGYFLTALAETPNEILKCAMYLFLGYLVQPNTLVSRVGTSRTSVVERCAVGEAESYRPQFARSCGGGGSSSDLPWGRNPDEDDRRFAYLCMMQAHKMLKPSQPKRSMNGRR